MHTSPGIHSTGWHLASWGPGHQEVLEFAFVAEADLHDEFNLPAIALIDTACTLCMHSKYWREAYEARLPAHLACTKTDRTRNFSFANGSRERRVPVWIIPSGIAGEQGQLSMKMSLAGQFLKLYILTTRVVQEDKFLDLGQRVRSSNPSGMTRTAGFVLRHRVHH